MPWRVKLSEKELKDANLTINQFNELSDGKKLRLHFLRQVHPIGKHWLWIGATSGGTGRGATQINDKLYKASRVSMHLFRGFDLDDERFILHKNFCNQGNCVNPFTCLYIGTHTDNMKDKNELKTHCVNGHEFTPENTYVTSKGERQCKRCKTLRVREKYRREHPGIKFRVQDE